MPGRRKRTGGRGKRFLNHSRSGWRISNHPAPLVSIIIPAMNERATLSDVLYEAGRVHPCSETIVVANGSKDGTPLIARKRGARVITSEEPLGHDVGRRVGAEAAFGKVLLFIDADMVIPASELRPFIKAVIEGVDIALNDYSGPADKSPTHPVILYKYALNALLGRPDLKGASLTAVPHAMSRRAIEVIGYSALEIPPVALAMAVNRGLQIKAVHKVAVGKINPRRFKGGNDPLTGLIAGDHLEAIQWLIHEKGHRGGFSDLYRQRNKVR